MQRVQRRVGRSLVLGPNRVAALERHGSLESRGCPAKSLLEPEEEMESG